MKLNILQREINLSNVSLILAPLCFLVSMIIIAPQQLELGSSVGQPHRMLSSINLEYQAWVISHLFMLLGITLYLPAFNTVCKSIAQKNVFIGNTLLVVSVIAVVGIVGQLAVDFIYAVLSQQPDLVAAHEIRLSIINNDIIQYLFNITANVGLLVAMLGIAITSIVTGWGSRLSGVLILTGWAVILLLNGKIVYIEAVGHGIILLGFLFSISKNPVKKDY